MTLSNFGSLVLQMLIFMTTLVNFAQALGTLDALTLWALYAVTKLFVTPPESGIIAKCQLGYLYENVEVP